MNFGRICIRVGTSGMFFSAGGLLADGQPIGWFFLIGASLATLGDMLP